MDAKINTEIEEALKIWLKCTGATYHPNDIERFYDFTISYIKNNGDISKNEFVKRVKKTTYTSRNENRGIAQEFYKRLEIINGFGKYLIEKKLL